VEPRPKVIARFHTAEFREKLRDADVILGIDEETGNEFMVFGRSTLDGIVAAGERPLLWAKVAILRATDELEALLAAVQEVKGYHEYEGYNSARDN
jgi:hypothetical protein